MLIWALVEPARLTGRVRGILSDADIEILISEASIWEHLVEGVAVVMRQGFGAHDVRKRYGHQSHVQSANFGEQYADRIANRGQPARMDLAGKQGIFRVMYVTKFADTIHVLHCFQKKAQKTSATDLEIATRRYKDLQKEQAK